MRLRECIPGGFLFVSGRSNVNKYGLLVMVALLATGLRGSCDEGSKVGVPTQGDRVREMAKWYKPGHFDSSTFYLMASSHNDIAYLDDPKGTADFRAESLIGPALELMKTDDSFALDIESTLFLKEYLARHAERIDEIRKRIQQKRLSFGGRYTQFYEAMYGGEALVRQMYFGRKWLKRTLGGDCDTRIVWDTDVPQRTLQSPQVFAKAGIKYLMIGRFPRPESSFGRAPTAPASWPTRTSTIPVGARFPGAARSPAGPPPPNTFSTCWRASDRSSSSTTWPILAAWR